MFGFTSFLFLCSLCTLGHRLPPPSYLVLLANGFGVPLPLPAMARAVSSFSVSTVEDSEGKDQAGSSSSSPPAISNSSEGGRIRKIGAHPAEKDQEMVCRSTLDLFNWLIVRIMQRIRESLSTRIIAS